ncbi:MAG: hypothetical protein HOV68_06235, partial [Streptomycetaceae bacterium]|nr:hypothetical protein [Streptomycetaceae bacterium]
RVSVYTNAQHPYTHTLLTAVPELDPDKATARSRVRIVGDAPSPISPPSGCRFRTRCPKAQPLCAEQEPQLNPLAALVEGHRVACHFPGTAAETAAASEAAAARDGGKTAVEVEQAVVPAPAAGPDLR